MMKSEKDIEREEFIRQYVLNRALASPNTLDAVGAAGGAIAAWRKLESFLKEEGTKR